MRLPRVLIIDDNEMNVELTTFVLSRAEMCVDSAADAYEGMRKIESFHPDMILMDIQMPDMDGLELTRSLKASPSMRHIAVVAFTAYAMKGDEEKMRRAGCDGYISKPIDVRTLADEVRSYCRPASSAG